MFVVTEFVITEFDCIWSINLNCKIENIFLNIKVYLSLMCRNNNIKQLCKVCLCEIERESEWEREEWVWERDSVCEREIEKLRDSVCVCVCVRERDWVCLCVFYV